MPVKQTEALEEVARLAAKEAVKEHEKQTQRNKRTKIFQNTKKLMENYNRICQSVEEGVAELSDMDNREELEEFTEEDIFINSILKSKLRSIVMIGHIDGIALVHPPAPAQCLFCHRPSSRNSMAASSC